jgi:hypothetical protein
MTGSQIVEVPFRLGQITSVLVKTVAAQPLMEVVDRV